MSERDEPGTPSASDDGVSRGREADGRRGRGRRRVRPVAARQGERDELVDTLRRVQADFENYRKRVLREQTALVERATERLVEDLLPVLDSFDGALGSLAGADSPEAEKVRDGVIGIRSQLVAVLEKAGLERIEADGAPFDPNEHEAVLQDDGDGEPHVAETMRTGLPPEGPRAASGDGPGAHGEAEALDGSAAGVVRQGLLRRARRVAGRDREGHHARLPQAGQAVPPRRQRG